MDDGPLPEAVLGVSRSVTGRRWVWREADARTAMAIAQRAELPELIGRLLAARGVGIDAVTDFLELASSPGTDSFAQLLAMATVPCGSFRGF